MGRRTPRGITLIELLTVIAIIALLVALLFPVFSRVQESRRQATCISNMHALYQAVSLYSQDEGAYPCHLLGPAERADGLPWVAGDPTPVEAGRIRNGPLFPRYMRDIDQFHCPNNPDRDQRIVTTAAFPEWSPWRAILQAATGQPGPTFDLGGFCFEGLPDSYSGKPISFYAYDSYDITSLIGADGRRLGRGAFQIVYARDWTAAEQRGVDPRQDSPNQMRYTNPDPARTVVTWCNYHVSDGGADKSPTLLLSGSVKPLDYRQLLQHGYQVANR